MVIEVTIKEEVTVGEKAVGELIRAMYSTGGFFSKNRLPEVNLFMEKATHPVDECLRTLALLPSLTGSLRTGTGIGPRSTRELVPILMRIVGFFILKSFDFFKNKLTELKEPEAVFSRFTQHRERMAVASAVFQPWLDCCTRWDVDISQVGADVARVLQSLHSRLQESVIQKYSIPSKAVMQRWMSTHRS